MNKKVYYFLVIFLFLDICYSFIQHYYLQHDGDMAAIIAPAEWYAEVLKDPFGISVFTEYKVYSGTNRFFAHWSLGAYFKTMPFLLQLIVNPLDSTYLASAVAKIVIQLLLIWIIATFITGSGNWRKPDFILAAALITPLFQTKGLFDRMAIIDTSITYTFFYPLSLATLLLFFLPFYRVYHLGQKREFTFLKNILLLALVIILPFQGPLNLGVIAIVCSAVLVYRWWQNFISLTGTPFLQRIVNAIFKIPGFLLFYFTLIILVSLYSFYIGTFNGENDSSIAIAERYPRLLTGINQQLFYGVGAHFGPAYSILLLMILVNSFIMWKRGSAGKRIVKMLFWSSVFSLLYILILPMGGYRSYRPYMLSSSTFLPVTLVIVFFYGLTCLYVLRNVKLKYPKYYIGALLIIGAAFSIMERPNSDTHNCERQAIREIATSPDKEVKLDTWCGVLSWDKITNPYFSVPGGRLLHYWGITKEDKTYTTRNE